jgi:hypothetical protein
MAIEGNENENPTECRLEYHATGLGNKQPTITTDLRMSNRMIRRV